MRSYSWSFNVLVLLSVQLQGNFTIVAQNSNLLPQTKIQTKTHIYKTKSFVYVLIIKTIVSRTTTLPHGKDNIYYCWLP